MQVFVSILMVVVIGGLGLACPAWCDRQAPRDPDDDQALLGFWRRRKR